MKRGAALVLLLTLGLGPSPPAGAFFSNTAGSTAQFLRLGAGARALGMGEAYGPVAEGPDSIYWNPAGIAKLQGPEASYSHAEMLHFFHHDYAAYAHPVSWLGGSLGGSVTLFYQDALDSVSNTNQIVGRFSTHSEAYTVAYAKAFGAGENYRDRDKAYFQDSWNIPDVYQPLDHKNDLWSGNLLLGVAAKFVSESIYDRHAGAAALDGGVIFRHYDLPELSLSFAFHNVGTKEHFISLYESLPAEADFGVCYDAIWETRRFISAFEIAAPYYGAPFGKLGFEYSTKVAYQTYAAVRVGYKTLSAPDLSPLSGLTGGVGLRYSHINFDFSFQPMDALGEIYRGSVGYRF